MAEAAGLGQIGKNGLIFHPRYGPRLMLGGVVTTAALPGNACPGHDLQGCPDDCSVCRDVCPVKAISKTGEVDRAKCAEYSMDSHLFSFMLKSGRIQPRDIPSIFNTANVDGNTMYNCTKCVSECPVI